MKELVSSTREAVRQSNWYAALTLALTLPDICGYLEDPTQKSGARYSAWFTAYVSGVYTFNGHQFLTGKDCYALRCAFLHQGEVDIGSQPARKALDSFHFITPPGNGLIVHRNQSGGRLQLEVDIFAEEICKGVEMWLAARGTDSAVSQRLASLGKIHDSRSGVRF